MTPQDWLMEAFSIIGLVAMFAYIIYYYPRLPRVIPAHFNEYGAPQGSGSRNEVWIIPAITLLMHFIMPFRKNMNVFFRSRHFLKRVYTQAQFNKRIRLFRYNKLVVTWGLFYISVSTIRMSLHTGAGIPVWFTPVFCLLLVVPVIYYYFFAK